MNQRVKMGGIALTSTILVIIGVILVNVLFSLLSERFSLSLDLSKEGMYEVDPKAIDVLQDLPEDVTFTVMSREDQTDLILTETLSKYATYSGNKVKVRYLDPNLNPNIKDEYHLETLNGGDIVVSSARRNKRVSVDSLTEQGDVDYYTGQTAPTGLVVDKQFVSAILYVTSEVIPSVVFTDGHGEVYSDMTTFDEILSNNSFEALSRNLSLEEIPENTELLVTVAPQNDLTAIEVERITAFLKRGGNWMVLHNEPPTGNLALLLKEFGMEVENAVVVDSKMAITYPYLIVPEMGTHDINSTIDASNKFLVAPAVNPIKMLFEDRSGYLVTALLKSSDSSYSKDLAAENLNFEKQEGDVTGPFNVAVISEKYYQVDNASGKTSRVILMSKNILANEFLVDSYLNRSFVTAIVAAIKPSSPTVDIAAKTFINQPLNLIGVPRIIVIWGLAAIVPLCIFVTGFLVWRKRRHL